MEIKIMMLIIVLTVLACFVHWLGCRLTAMLFCDSKHHMKRVACHLSGALLNFVVAYLSLFIWVTCHMDGKYNPGVVRSVEATNYYAEKRLRDACELMPVSICSERQKQIVNATKKRKPSIVTWYFLLWDFALANFWVMLIGVFFSIIFFMSWILRYYNDRE